MYLLASTRADRIRDELTRVLASEALCDALSNLAQAHHEGKHVITGSTQLLDALVGARALTEDARGRFREIKKHHAVAGSLRDAVTHLAEIEPREGDIHEDNSGGKRIYRVPLSYFSDSARTQASRLVAEDRDDARVYQRAAAGYVSRVAPRGIACRLDPYGGGGQNTADALRDHALHGPTVCVVDADFRWSSDEGEPSLGGTRTPGLVPSEPHEVLIVALREQPALLGTLVTKLGRARLPRGLAPVDATVRFVKTAEVKLDVLYRRGRAWTIVEVQRAIDPKKRRRWLLAVGLLFDQTRTLGDLIVITPRAIVARWATRVVHARAPLGTEVWLKPAVFLVGEPEVEALLDEEHPELALFAAWAMQYRHGPKARAIMERAVELTERLPRSLRHAQMRAIVSMLSARMKALLREASMNPDKIPETPAARKLRLFLEAQGRKRGRAEGEAKGRAEGKAEGRAEGKQEALLTLLRARSLSPTREDEASVRACTDAGKLDQWIERAATAASVREVLGARKNRKPSVPPARRAAGRRSRTAGVTP